MSDVQHEHERKRLEAGTRVGDHLVVRSILGQGGTAIVYEALHTRLGSSVALKVLNVAAEFEHDGALRLQREAEVCASIDDPHVPRIYDVGALPDGTPYFVMEKVSGVTLEEMLLSGPLSIDAALEIAFDLLKALEAVHRAGIVHRDIKPANLIVRTSSDGVRQVRLMDFGVSKSICREVSCPKLTRVGMVVGTPHYMAPEQITGEATDARADVYATGVLMFEMLAGTIPFDGQSTAEIVAAVLRHEPRRLGSLRADLPKGLEAVVMRAMAARPSDRFLTVRDLVSALSGSLATSRVSTQDPVWVLHEPRGVEAPECTSEFGGHADPRLSLPPPPRGFSNGRPADMLGGASSSRRFSVLGAGVAVLIGTMGFPAAAKHGAPVVEVARADSARSGAQQALGLGAAQPPLPDGVQLGADFEASEPNGEDPVGALAVLEPVLSPAPQGALADSAEHDPAQEEAPAPDNTWLHKPNLRLDFLQARLQLAPPSSLGALVPQLSEREASGASVASKEEERAERLARRRLREAEEEVRKADREFERQEAARGILLSDYVRRLEAIQQQAREESSELPAAARESLPDNPYSHDLTQQAP